MRIAFLQAALLVEAGIGRIAEEVAGHENDEAGKRKIVDNRNLLLGQIHRTRAGAVHCSALA